MIGRCNAIVVSLCLPRFSYVGIVLDVYALHLVLRVGIRLIPIRNFSFVKSRNFSFVKSRKLFICEKWAGWHAL